MQGRIIELVSVSKRVVIAKDGGAGDIVVFLDDDGDETADASDAVYATIQWRDTLQWSCVRLSDFLVQTIH